MIEAVPAFLAWAGASAVVLADGRRGLAAGLAVLTLGLVWLAIAGGDLAAGLILAAAGAVAAFQRWRSGPPGWGIMPPGSTARLVMCVASGLVALWVAASITSGPGGQLRFAVLATIGLSGARVLASRDATIVMTAVAGLALAAAAASGLAGSSSGLLPYAAGALVAAGATLIPQPQPRGS